MTDQQPAAETIEEIANKITRRWGSQYRTQLSAAIISALRDRDERAAKIADERAAFNRRLAKMHKTGDPIADLKFTRADEAEVIAKEIRSADA